MGGPHILWSDRAPDYHENLSGEELWLPLVDSLSSNLSAPRDVRLQSFYVEKSADTPSDHGVHIQPVNDGYQWIGRSTTYAHRCKEKRARSSPSNSSMHPVSRMPVGMQVSNVAVAPA